MQTALGRSDWESEAYGKRFAITLYVMKNDDLIFPLSLGIDFMMSSGIILDFSKAVYTLPSKNGDEDRIYPFSSNEAPSLPHLLFYLAVPFLPNSTEYNQLVQQIVQAADTIHEYKTLLQRMMKE